MKQFGSKQFFLLGGKEKSSTFCQFVSRIVQLTPAMRNFHLGEKVSLLMREREWEKITFALECGERKREKCDEMRVKLSGGR